MSTDRPPSGHICTPFRGFRQVESNSTHAMVSKDRIQEEEMTQEEVMDRMTEEPRTEVEILPEWEEHPEEAPGDEVYIEDDTLVWTRDGFEVRLESYETTHWRAEIDIPHRVGQWFPRAIDLKTRSIERGFVDKVEIEDYSAITVVAVFQDNYQPTYDVNAYIDDLEEHAEQSEEFKNDMEEKLSVAESEG